MALGRGKVVTARGEIFDMDATIMKSKRPANYKEVKSESTRQTVDKTPPMNIRGYMPSAPSVVIPSVVAEIKTALVEREVVTEEEDTTAIGDFTGIKVEKSTYMKAIKDKLPAGVTPKDVAEQVVINEILNNMKSSHPNANSAAEVRDRKKDMTQYLTKISTGDDVTDLASVE